MVLEEDDDSEQVSNAPGTNRADHRKERDNDAIAKSLEISYKSLEDGSHKVEAVYLDPHDWRRQGPRLLTGVQAMAALSRKNIAANEKYRSVNGLLETCRTDFLRERAYLWEVLRKLGHSGPRQTPPMQAEEEESSGKKGSKEENEFMKYLLYADFPMDPLTKSIMLKNIQTTNEADIAERDKLRAKVKLLGGGKYDGLLKILQNSGMKLASLLLTLLDVLDDDKDKAAVVDIATKNLKARVAALEAKIRTVEVGELPAVQKRQHDSEEQTNKQKHGLEQLSHNLEKIEHETAETKEETEKFQTEVSVLKESEKKWTDAGNSSLHEEARQELVALKEAKEKELVEQQEKVRTRWQQCEKVEKEIEKVKDVRVQMAEEIAFSKQRLKQDLEQAELESVAMTASAMDAELVARKQEEETSALREQQKELAKEVQDVAKDVEKRKIPPMKADKLKEAEAALAKKEKENKEIEQKDATLKLEIRHAKRKIETLEEMIAEKEKLAAEEAEKNEVQNVDAKGRKSFIQKGKTDLREIDPDEDPDTLPYQMRLRHPERKEETHEQRLTSLFSDAKGKKRRETQFRESVANERKTVISAQLEAAGHAAQEDYPTVGDTGPVSPISPLSTHDGERLGLTAGFAELHLDHEGRASKVQRTPASNMPISAYRYKKQAPNSDIDVKLAAAQRRLKCTSDRLEKMASKEARLNADLTNCQLSLSHWIELETKLCTEVDGELSELIAALAPSTQAQEEAKAKVEAAAMTYRTDLIKLHHLMKKAEADAQEGIDITQKEQDAIHAANRKVQHADKEVCEALKQVKESVSDQEGLCQIVQGALNEHIDIEKHIVDARTHRLECREGVIRWGKLLAEERAEVQRMRRERNEWMSRKTVLEEEAASVTLELIREAHAVAECDDDESNKRPATGSSAVARMESNRGHKAMVRSAKEWPPSPEQLQRIKVVPHGVSSNVSTGISMDSCIPSKPPKGNKKSLFPCLVKDEWGDHDDTRVTSVSTTATFNNTFNNSSSSFDTSFSTSFHGSHPGDGRNQNQWPAEMQQLRAGTAEPRLHGRHAAHAASQPNLVTHQAPPLRAASRKPPSAAMQPKGDDLRVAQVGRLRGAPLPMKHASAKGRPTDRPYVPEERWCARPGNGLRFGFASGQPDRTY